MKIGILGSATPSRDGIPWDDKSWTLWGLPWNVNKRVDAFWEMHDESHWKDYTQDRSEYLDRLNAPKIPVFMRKKDPRVPTSVTYPLEDVVKLLKRDGWRTSSIAYALAYAIYLKPEKIGIWGVDMASNEEYTYQRWALEYLIGFAEGRGIKVIIPEQSALTKANHVYGAPGKDGPNQLEGFTLDWIENRKKGYEKDKAEAKVEYEQLVNRLNVLNGAQFGLNCPIEGREAELEKVKVDIKTINMAIQQSMTKLTMLEGVMQELTAWGSYGEQFNRGYIIPTRAVNNQGGGE